VRPVAHASGFAGKTPCIAPGTHWTTEINVIQYRQARIPAHADFMEREEETIRAGIWESFEPQRQTRTDAPRERDEAACSCRCLALRRFAIGFASSPAAYFTFPVSKDICLLARPCPGSHSLSAYEVRLRNRDSVTRADTQLYAPFKSTGVQKLFDRVAREKGKPRRILFPKGRIVQE